MVRMQNPIARTMDRVGSLFTSITIAIADTATASSASHPMSGYMSFSAHGFRRDKPAPTTIDAGTISPRSISVTR